MTDRDLMQQALEALESLFNGQVDAERGQRCASAATALRERLSHCDRCGKRLGAACDIHTCSPQKPEQEPVAWANEIIDDLHALHDSEMIRELDSGDALIRLDAAIAAVEEATQRYTAPHPAQQPREWQELTDEELRSAYCEVSGKEWCLGGMSNAESFYEAIDAKLR